MMIEFKQLHQQKAPLLLANVWDVTSAKCAEQAGYQAIGTSSAALAAVLGYEDGEHIPFEELLFVVKRIAASSRLPLSVDMESGFSADPHIIANHIQQLAKLGVVGVNIEDSRVRDTRTLCNKDEFAALLQSVRAELTARDVPMFINVRCDAFLLGVDNAVNEALSRASSYQAAGADGLFFPCISREQDIIQVIAATPLPINVMAVPSLLGIEILTKLGVKRVSTGNFAQIAMNEQLSAKLLQIKTQGSCSVLFE
ncbi:isocitrate lyase/phosphoenolpyruvate mutase family protein [Pseudoalteromonas luteoviolacea]|uniref:isocitrate lyase/PEP mutase family protein n=1 Tax=Pseudoalteromonas luteoviolacea TaxID=43657 RepID=UPI001F33C1F3|nr:isocitrate lyase/phosphoenolpyruvate mutase family protein [Pseudoalteromonas luteoviolacea]MCF6439923.1 isocitrate lyase/phosphoenolpyruvate mutase family protein [Pseudoalteromonas luteoviolacea]